MSRDLKRCEPLTIVPRKAGRAEAKPREFEQKRKVYISLKVSVLLPGNSANKV